MQKTLKFGGLIVADCIGREYNSSTELYYNVYIRTECDIGKQDYYWR